MPEYLFIGTMTLRGVAFLIDAPTLQDAKKRAEAGSYDDAKEAEAEVSDWQIDPATGEINFLSF